MGNEGAWHKHHPYLCLNHIAEFTNKSKYARGSYAYYPAPTFLCPTKEHMFQRHHSAMHTLPKGLCTVGCAAWGAGEWLGVVQRVLLARWRLGASFRGVVWGALTVSVVAAGMRCGRRCRLRCRLRCRVRCRLRCRLGWCIRRTIMSCRGYLLVPVHMGVCCAGGMPAGRCRLLSVVFPG